MVIDPGTGEINVVNAEWALSIGLRLEEDNAHKYGLADVNNGKSWYSAKSIVPRCENKSWDC